MEKIEIDRQLALAIGYLPEDVASLTFCIRVWRKPAGWLQFSHTDPTVIWPLAKHYKCFPRDSRCQLGKWFARVEYADTPEEAVAMAIIKGSRK